MSQLRRDDDWQHRAACAGTQGVAFYAPDHERERERLVRETKARSICATCAVCAQCLSYALDVREMHGIWGGLNELERRELLNRRHAV